MLQRESFSRTPFVLPRQSAVRLPYLLLFKFKSHIRILMSNLYSGDLPDQKSLIGVPVKCTGVHFRIERVDEMLPEPLEPLGDFSSRLMPQIKVPIHCATRDRLYRPYPYAMCTHHNILSMRLDKYLSPRRMTVQLSRTGFQSFSVCRLINDTRRFRLSNTSKLPCCKYLV